MALGRSQSDQVVKRPNHENFEYRASVQKNFFWRSKNCQNIKMISSWGIDSFELHSITIFEWKTCSFRHWSHWIRIATQNPIKIDQFSTFHTWSTGPCAAFPDPVRLFCSFPPIENDRFQNYFETVEFWCNFGLKG